ncbi:hypothetical protein CPJCM30710_29680 [Clostridium polyendosporum]|uniref:Zn-dependent protease with chaperone function n=1 Tax=Clostridium polyendosporum TaxID=69208 RepID=A0A919VHI8_9CLOT|nr:M48 family metallopeptidase [Clostridium polyendosporum]GIM30302.1 hypothetical protein CPJCM30710_29680 [Clostridium polyendosporum]
MKKFFINSMILFVFLSLFIYIITLTIQYTETNKLKSNSKIELSIKEQTVTMPKPLPKAEANYSFSKVFFVIRLVLSVTIPLIFIAFGGIAIINSFRGNELIRLLKFIFIYLIFDFLLTLPVTFFSSFYRLKLVGLSNATLSLWSENLFKELIITLIIVTALGWIPYIIFLKYKHWYIIFALLTIPIGILTSIISPLYIDPVFNEIKPLEDKQLEDKIVKMTNKVGIEDVKLYEVDKSKETKALNAYMTGIFNVKRIVIWDNTLKALNEKELLSIVAHEVGHYKLRHIPKAIALSSIFSLLILTLVNYIYKGLYFKYGKGWAVTGYKSLSAIPIILVIFTLLSILLQPLSNTYSRKVEMDADKFAIELSHDNLTNGVLEVRFMESNLSMDDVNWIFKLWVYDHPTPKERIEMSNSYKPWENDTYQFKRYIK